ncbi:hypothetical protein ACJX0J_037838, partial [Zea mays]
YPDSEEKNGSQKYDVFFHFYVLLHLGCGLTAIPHIESRVRHFRTKYGAIEVMLANSGFSWDENRKMVQCEKQQYEDHYILMQRDDHAFCTSRDSKEGVHTTYDL